MHLLFRPENDGREPMAALRDLACLVERDGLVLVSFANSQYLRVLENWLVAIDRLGIPNLIVVALDQMTQRFLEERNVGTVLFPGVQNAAALWKKRIEVLMELNGAGIDVIHSDIDAVWLRDPVAEFFCDKKYDVIASQGTIWPEDVHRHWGFVLCCGLVCFRATSSSRSLLDAVRWEIATTDDDQIALNRVMLADAIQWEIEAPYHLPHNDKSVLCSEKCIVGRGETINVSVLPHHLFQRLRVPSAEAFIVHPPAPKRAAPKKEALDAAGGWFLNPSDKQPVLSDVGILRA
jgi:Nucleotide-diphospho-sugar transferase